MRTCSFARSRKSNSNKVVGVKSVMFDWESLIYATPLRTARPCPPRKNAGLGKVLTKFKWYFYIYKNNTMGCMWPARNGGMMVGRAVRGCCIYSMPPVEPASEGALLPTGMLVSTAIISARMSRTGLGTVLS